MFLCSHALRYCVKSGFRERASASVKQHFPRLLYLLLAIGVIALVFMFLALRQIGGSQQLLFLASLVASVFRDLFFLMLVLVVVLIANSCRGWFNKTSAN